MPRNQRRSTSTSKKKAGEARDKRGSGGGWQRDTIKDEVTVKKGRIILFRFARPHAKPNPPFLSFFLLFCFLLVLPHVYRVFEEAKYCHRVTTGEMEKVIKIYTEERGQYTQNVQA
jgi:hypothetical protein